MYMVHLIICNNALRRYRYGYRGSQYEVARDGRTVLPSIIHFSRVSTEAYGLYVVRLIICSNGLLTYYSARNLPPLSRGLRCEVGQMTHTLAKYIRIPVPGCTYAYNYAQHAKFPSSPQTPKRQSSETLGPTNPYFSNHNIKAITTVTKQSS
jgi:hypothetical protein